QITVAAYDNSGAMLGSKTVTGDFAEAQTNDKVTVPIDFDIPNGTAEIQAIAYDSTETLNALSPAYTADEAAISLMATYDSGKITTRSDLAEYKGKEAICRITDDETGNEVYIRQETVSDDTFKTIHTGALDGTYTVKFGVSGEGVVATEKAYTTVNITTDNEETADTLYSWNFDTDQTAASGNNVPVISGNAAYDEANGAVKLTSTDASGGALNINFDEAVKAVTGQKITVVSKVAYGRQSGKYTDYTISDSAGKELVSAHIQMYSSSSAQSLKIGGTEQIESGLPAGIAETKNKKNSGIDNGYSIYTTVLDPDAKTIELTVSNAEGESTFKGKFPEESSIDLGTISFSANHTYSARSSFVDDISVSRTTEASYTMSFDVKDSQNNIISNPAITVTDKTYNTVISPEQDGTYKLCEGLYEYTVTADGYGTVKKELELSPATPSKTISVTLPASSAKTANITVQYYDEESNKIKDDVTLSEEYETDGTYTVPSEYTKDFTLKTDEGLTNYYKFNASKSQVTAPYSENIIIRLEYNLTEQYNYYEDFENYEFSSDNWHVQSSSVPNPTFETDKTKYLKHTTLQTTTGGYMTFDEVNTTNKKAHITADVKFTEPTGSSKGNSQFAISNTNPSFSSNNITYGIKSDSSGHVIVFEYNGGSTFYVNGEAANMDFIGDWIHIEADADFGQKTIKITLTNEAGLSAEFDTSFFSSSLAGNVGSFYVRSAGSSGSVSVDNLSLKITGTAEPAIVSVLNNKSVYAFGDSIVYGHNAPTQSFMQLIANDYGMNLSMMAKNGATVIDSSNDILAQVNGAPSEAPDFVV
ncbi:MAG: hypothetical protein IJP94_02445, partial [Clostridia bacterium]|nr:hypothetical protein [Clostridia bacterium]